MLELERGQLNTEILKRRWLKWAEYTQQAMWRDFCSGVGKETSSGN